MSTQNVSQPKYICSRNSRNNLLFPDYNSIFVPEGMKQNKPLIISGLEVEHRRIELLTSRLRTLRSTS